MSFNVGDYVKFKLSNGYGSIDGILPDNYYLVKYHTDVVLRGHFDELVQFFPAFKPGDLIFKNKKLWTIVRYSTYEGKFRYLLKQCKNPFSSWDVEDPNEMRLLFSRDNISEQPIDKILIYVNVLEKASKKLENDVNEVHEEMEELENEIYRKENRLKALVQISIEQTKQIQEQRDYDAFLEWLPKDKQKEFQSLYFQYALTPK